MYNICKCSSNLHQHIKIRIKNVPGDWDETCVPKLGLKTCTGGSRGLAPGELQPMPEERLSAMGLKLVVFVWGSWFTFTWNKHNGLFWHICGGNCKDPSTPKHNLPLSCENTLDELAEPHNTSDLAT